MSTVQLDTQDNHQHDTITELTTCLHRQREAYHADPVPDLEQRKKDLLALKRRPRSGAYSPATR